MNENGPSLQCICTYTRLSSHISGARTLTTHSNTHTHVQKMLKCCLRRNSVIFRFVHNCRIFCSLPEPNILQQAMCVCVCARNCNFMPCNWLVDSSHKRNRLQIFCCSPIATPPLPSSVLNLQSQTHTHTQLCLFNFSASPLCT